MRDLREADQGSDSLEHESPGSDRRRRLRDAVEAALSDVMLLGTPEQVRLAVGAANDVVAGRNVEMAQLVVSLRTFIREVLDLDAVPADLSIPKQGPLRPATGASRAGRGERAGGGDGARKSGQQSGEGGSIGGAAATLGAGAGAGEVDTSTSS